MPGDPGANINRYLDLLSELPKGEFYTEEGVRVPYRGSKATDLIVQTSQAVRVFGIFLNDKFQGTVTTDDNGVARVSIVLDHGRNVIILEDDVTAQRIQTFLDAQVIHTWLAALAEVIENIDENITDTENDRRLETSERNQIEDVWGKRLLHPNTPLYGLEAYREALQEVHQAYRVGGGKQLGLDDVVGALTSTTPLNFPFRTFGPRWALGSSFLRNADFQARNRAQFSRASAIPGVTIDTIGRLNQTGSGTLAYTSVIFDGLSWTPPGGSAGANINVTGGGTFTIPGPRIAAQFDGRLNETFNITASSNDTLRLNLDGLGSIDITLTAGAARTAAQIVTDINAALNADARYGASYNSVASSIATTRVRLTGVVTGEAGTILLEDVDDDAYSTVFGYPWVRSTLVGAEAIGDTALEIVDSDGHPYADSDNTWRAWLARNTAREETIEIVGNDTTTDTLTAVSTGLVLAKNAGDTVEVDGAFPQLQIGSDNEEEGVVVTVVIASLPAPPDSETVTVDGSNVPDFWLADNVAGADADLLDSRWFDFHQLTLENDGTGDTTLEAEADSRVWNYKEWPFTFSVWVRNRHTASVNIFLGVDFGSGFSEDGGTAVPSMNADGGDAMTFLSYDVVLPATATQFRCRIRHDSAAVTETIEVARSKLTQPYVTAISMGVNTTPRSEHRAQLGELIYLWSPDELTSAENDLVGLSSPTTLGHVDYVLPAHVQGDRFDVTEYSGGEPVNLRGAFDEAELFAGTLTNVALQVRTPARRSHIAPSRISRVEGESLSFPDPAVAPYTATLAVTSDQDQAAAVMYENGIPFPNDLWQFNDATEVEITSAFDETAEYTIDYQALIQFESAAIDLSGTFSDYVWYVDYHAWTRYEPEQVSVSRTAQAVFDPRTFRARLRDRSDRDKTATTLTENNGLDVRTVPTAGYRYVDNRTIQIASDEFNEDAVYFLKYNALRISPSQVPTVVVEYRRATTPVLLAAASYATIAKDDVLPAVGRYLQLRISVSTVVDVRDFRLTSVSAKGLGLIGAGLTVPVLRP